VKKPARRTPPQPAYPTPTTIGCPGQPTTRPTRTSRPAYPTPHLLPARSRPTLRPSNHPGCLPCTCRPTPVSPTLHPPGCPPRLPRASRPACPTPPSHATYPVLPGRLPYTSHPAWRRGPLPVQTSAGPPAPQTPSPQPAYPTLVAERSKAPPWGALSPRLPTLHSSSPAALKTSTESKARGWPSGLRRQVRPPPRSPTLHPRPARESRGAKASLSPDHRQHTPSRQSSPVRPARRHRRLALAGKSRRRRAYPQQIVTTRLLYCLQDPFAQLSRLQRI
jgi:hypothetical protein